MWKDTEAAQGSKPSAPALSFRWASLTKHELKEKTIENFKMAAEDHYAPSAGALGARVPGHCTGHTPRTLGLEAGEYAASSAVTAVTSGKVQPGYRRGQRSREGPVSWARRGWPEAPSRRWGGVASGPLRLCCRAEGRPRRHRQTLTGEPLVPAAPDTARQRYLYTVCSSPSIAWGPQGPTVAYLTKR